MEITEHDDKRKWIIISAIVLKIIMDGLDGSMLNIALPTISQSLGVTSSAVIWIVSAYSITVSSLILFFGRLGDIVGKSRFFVIGVAIYTLSTLVSGLADSLWMLIAARIIQAFGSSCTMANSQGIITMVFPPHLRGRAMGIYGGAISLGLLAGPTLGGLIVAYMDWHYIFLLKVPLAVLALYIAIRYFPKDTPEVREKMDFAGAALYVTSVAPLLYSLQQGYSAGYTNIAILTGLAVSAIAFTAFFLLQIKKPMPLLDLSIFKNPVYTITVFTAFIVTFTNSFQNIIIPFYMQGVLGTPPNIAGMYMSASPIIVLLVAPVSGILTDKIGGEKLALVGQIINCTGLLLMMTLTKTSPVIMLISFICVISFGSSLYNSPSNTLIMSTVPREKLGIGGSANMCIRNIGQSMGVAFTTSVLYGGMSKVMGYHVSGYVRDSGMEDAFMYGMRSTFLIASSLCVVGIAISAWRIASVHRRKSSVKEEPVTNQ